MSSLSAQLDRKIRRQALHRCGYCLLPQSLNPALLEIEHLCPTAKGGHDNEENLWLACRLCNGYKGTQTEAQDPETGSTAALFNPRTQVWREHFTWSEDQIRIIGQTPCGRATVEALKLNSEIILPVRQKWVSAGWFPPAD